MLVVGRSGPGKGQCQAIVNSQGQLRTMERFQGRQGEETLRRIGTAISRFAPQEMLERTQKQLEQAAWTIGPAEFMVIAIVSTITLFPPTD